MGLSYTKINADTWPTEDQLQYLVVLSAEGTTKEEALEALSLLCFAQGIDAPEEHPVTHRHYCGMLNKNSYSYTCCRCRGVGDEQVYNPVFVREWEDKWVATTHYCV